uniref:Uncharacterized protein n=1 Tax=Pseudo-nitzschia australis TaxID=44445 RepID=A0A7S4EE94_9STRA|mmetsp:Transcript_7290/g.16473  ORF Transcript_7290/g.16473 Transcript_7290/m.16473 type:complete len:832 (-) Transcript_7290:1468-3963(-)
MTTLLNNPTVPPGGDGIGLSLTIEHDEISNDTNVKPVADDKQADKEETTATPTSSKGQTTATPSFIPPSVYLSPIPFQKEEEDNNTTCHTVEVEEPHIISSIMRQPSTFKNGGGNEKMPSGSMQHNDPSHVSALEDRVRDLEEKLSTLSMLLLQKKQIQSPENSTYSISPPTTPFRSLESLGTIISSNVPVLESPIPISSRYRNKSGFDNSAGLRNVSLPYETRRKRNSNNNSNELESCKLRNNLSFHILHASNSELDLRSIADGGSNHGDGDENHLANNKADTNCVGGSLHTIHHNEDYENAIGTPTLDSLPGSSRTSPIQSKNPVVARVLSSEKFISSEAKRIDIQNNNNHNSDEIGDSHKTTFRAAKLDTSNANKDRNESTEKDAAATIGMNISHNSSSTNTNGNDGTTDAPKHQKKKSSMKSKWLDYLDSVQESNYDTDKQMEEFVKVPSAVEALLGFGVWISVDTFLYTLTMLPIRFAYSIFLLIAWVYKKGTGRAMGSFQFHRHNSYHIIQVTIIYVIYEYVLKPINISILYHWIRSQSMVKLYLVVAMVEVFDRLMCSLGQDCLDSLYWNTTRRPKSSRLIVSALVVLIYTALHSFLLFVHVATLNVAMNSDDQALLSLLIGGNFAEIKGTVFKKYNKASLFKIAASDICERFKLALFLILVLLLNASQGMDQKMLYNYLSMCGIIWCAEWLSDWLKHSFITKFNYIASSVYAEYSLLLAGDVSGFGHEGENLDKSHAVVKRLGLAQIPLVCVMAKYLKEAYKYQTYSNQPQTWLISLVVLSIWLFLLVCKLSLASFLQRISKMKLEAAPEFSKNNATVAKKKN